MVQSTIDAAVQKFRENSTHDWESLTIEGTTDEYCKRCGQPKDKVRIPGESYKYLPCRGFV